MPATPDQIAENLAIIHTAIARAAESAGRSPADVQLIAVSKTMPADAIRAAYPTGQRHFGENRVQELQAKSTELPGDICWHLIGHLQSNKVRAAIDCRPLIHAVDTAKLLKRIDLIASQAKHNQPLLLQANISGEETKFGESLDDLTELLDLADSLQHVTCSGFMTMAPYGASPEQLTAIFGALRDYRDRQQQRLGRALPHLSMGMSGDYPQAIACGATFVRIGTAIFGKR